MAGHDQRAEPDGCDTAHAGCHARHLRKAHALSAQALLLPRIARAAARARLHGAGPYGPRRRADVSPAIIRHATYVGRVALHSRSSVRQPPCRARGPIAARRAGWARPDITYRCPRGGNDGFTP